MKRITVSSLEALSLYEIESLAQSIRHNSFSMTTENAIDDFLPTGVQHYLLQKALYTEMLDDIDAQLKSILICVELDSELLQIPISVYGFSLKNKIRFPILINEIISDFIRLNVNGLSEITEIIDNNILMKRWGEISIMKMNLIKNIFAYYSKIDDESNSVMAWAIRDKNSFTRQIAESIPFHRTEEQALNTEFYHIHQLEPSKFKYVKECTLRWLSRQASEENSSIKVSTDLSRSEVYKHFFRSLLVE